MRDLAVLIKPASGTCNMECSYCFYKDEMRNRSVSDTGLMSEETLRAVVKRTIMRAENSITYAFQGGEPLLRGKEFYRLFISYVQKYNKNHVYVNNVIQTNGTLIDEEWCHLFRENHFLVGISIDGTEETNDAARHMADGAGTFTAICKALDLLQKNEIEFNILTVVDRFTAAHISEIYQFYRRQGWQYQQYIPCIPSLNQMAEQKRENRNSSCARYCQKNVCLSGKEYGEFLVSLFDLWYADYQHRRQPYIRDFENYIGILAGIEPESCSMRGKCSLQYVIEGNGDVFPCDFYALDEYCLGNLTACLLPDIDNAYLKSGFFIEGLRVPDICGKCNYYNLCRNGCRRMRQIPSESGKRNILCEGYQIFFSACLDRMNQIAQELICGFPDN